MKILLSDFGSTWTKLTAVDLDECRVLGTAAAFTTVETGIENGFNEALTLLREKIGDVEFDDQKACSSAAGGLRMMVSGLVPELTAKAARTAALGAGAKVIKVFSHEMTDDDLDLILEVKPDIFLLTGGTDGGNTACILENGEALKDLFDEHGQLFPLLIAGNRSAQRKLKKMFADYDVVFCPNVMPRLSEINVESAQNEIRKIFLERIVQAKGLSHLSTLMSDIILPTPGAILTAMELLSTGTDKEDGIGDLIAVDLGGATTDVYSICEGGPQGMATVMKGLPEPFAKRTVEGDLGMRYSIMGIVDAVGFDAIAETAGLTPERTEELINRFHDHKEQVPDNEETARLDLALASHAVATAVSRHAGTLKEVYTPMGQTFMQVGKDLRPVRHIVMTGGALIHADDPKKIVPFAQYDVQDPERLKPEKLSYSLDKKYILSAMGVLAKEHPDEALKIMKQELTHE